MKKQNRTDQIKTNTSPDKSIENNQSEKSMGIIDSFNKEMNWTAITAIAGASVLIWNILRYSFIFISSITIYAVTRVPFYLLMMRNNLPFTDVNLLYDTIIVVCIIISSTKYNPIPKKNIKKMLCWFIIPIIVIIFTFSIILMIYGILIILGGTILNNNFVYMFSKILLMFSSYFLPLFFMISMLFLGKIVNIIQDDYNRLYRKTKTQNLDSGNKLAHKKKQLLIQKRNYKLIRNLILFFSIFIFI